MAKKNKMKTHKGTKKVVNVSQSGFMKIGKPGSRHNTGKQNTASNRANRKGSVLHPSDYKRIKDII